MSENIQNTEVIVIGAGISGLAAAKVLAESGVDVLVLEARNRVGGRTWTVKNQKVGWVDLGGAYVGRTQNHLLRLIKELGLRLYPVNEVQHLVYYNAFTRGRGLFRNDQAPALSFWAALDVNHIFRLIDQMGEEISPAEPWKAVHAEEWDQMTFAEFVEANTTNEEARHFLRLFITLIITNEPYQSSLLWILWYIKQCGGTRAIFATTNGGQEFKVDGGTNQLTELLAARVGTGRVHLENAVYYLEQQQAEEGGHVLVKTLTGRTYTASYVIMATPPAVQQKIHYNPPLPAMRNQLIQRAPQGTVFKCIVYYERAFWKSQHMCGSLLLVGPDEEILIPYALDDSKPDGSYPAIVGFLPADKARKVASLTKEERLKVICSSYAKAFNCSDALQPIHYEEQNWSAEQYSGGCYTMTLGPGFLTRYGPYLRQPVGRLFYAGTECATEWSGYINGGIQAGERAARQVMAQLGRLPKAQQIDQIEPISLDYPPLPVQVSLFERYAPSARGLFRTVVLASVASISTVVAVIFKDHLGRLEEVVPFAWK